MSDFWIPRCYSQYGVAENNLVMTLTSLEVLIDSEERV